MASSAASAATSAEAADTVGGIVTIDMATVGSPNNPSVGVIQTFGGPKGKFVDPPTGTGIYPSCSKAPAAPPPCLTVGAVSYAYGIGEYETTVSQ